MTSSLAWVQDKIWSKAEDVILHVLAAGPIPQHVAFVMDGFIPCGWLRFLIID
jgi:hypothetical protein